MKAMLIKGGTTVEVEGMYVMEAMTITTIQKGYGRQISH
jgi:hypothetical protein